MFRDLAIDKILEALDFQSISANFKGTYLGKITENRHSYFSKDFNVETGHRSACLKLTLFCSLFSNSGVHLFVFRNFVGLYFNLSTQLQNELKFDSIQFSSRSEKSNIFF